MAASELPSVSEARELLPAWVVWGGDGWFLVASLLLTAPAVWLAVRFAILPLARAERAPWPERARLAYPARIVLHGTGTFLPPFFLFWGVYTGSALSPLPRVWLAGLVGMGVALWMVALHCRLERRLGDERLTFQDALRSVATRGLLFMPHLLVALAAAPFLPDDFDERALVGLAFIGMVSLFLAAGGNLSLIRLLGLARDASPRLHEICRRAAEQIGVTLRGVYEMDWVAVNALAFPVIQSVAFTPRAAARLTDDELLTVCGHELGHLRESKPAMIARLATALTVALLFASVRPVIGTFGPLGLVGELLVYLVLCRVFAGFSQRMEARADAAARAGEPDAGTFARALERIYEYNLIPAVLNSRNLLHPDLYDRLIAAGVEPAYPRPAPPSRWRTWGAIGLMAIPMAIAAAILGPVFDAVETASPNDESMQRLALALQFDPADPLGNLGLIRLDQGKYSGAIVLLRAATDLDPDSWVHPLNLARACLAAKGCDEAAAALRTARERYALDPFAKPSDSPLESVAQSIDACRGVRRPIVERPKPALVVPVPIEPDAEPPRVEPVPAPDVAPPPEEGRPWRRRGRGRGRFRMNPPMARWRNDRGWRIEDRGTAGRTVLCIWSA